jgi:hypothetical protein
MPTRTNYAKNPNGSRVATGWVFNDGGAAAVPVSSHTIQNAVSKTALRASGSTRTVSSGNTFPGLQYTIQLPPSIVPGMKLKAEVKFQWTQLAAVMNNRGVNIRFGKPGVPFVQANDDVQMSPMPGTPNPPSGPWVQNSSYHFTTNANAVVPALSDGSTPTYVNFLIYNVVPTNSAIQPYVIDATDALFQFGSDVALYTGYFDGDQQGFTWSGTPGNSDSINIDKPTIALPTQDTISLVAGTADTNRFDPKMKQLLLNPEMVSTGAAWNAGYQTSGFLYNGDGSVTTAPWDSGSTAAQFLTTNQNLAYQGRVMSGRIIAMAATSGRYTISMRNGSATSIKQSNEAGATGMQMTAGVPYVFTFTNWVVGEGSPGLVFVAERKTAAGVNQNLVPGESIIWSKPVVVDGPVPPPVFISGAQQGFKWDGTVNNSTSSPQPNVSQKLLIKSKVAMRLGFAAADPYLDSAIINAIWNPRLETDASYWNPNSSTITRIASPGITPLANAFFRITANGGGSPGPYYTATTGVQIFVKPGQKFSARFRLLNTLDAGLGIRAIVQFATRVNGSQTVYGNVISTPGVGTVSGVVPDGAYRATISFFGFTAWPSGSIADVTEFAAYFGNVPATPDTYIDGSSKFTLYTWEGVAEKSRTIPVKPALESIYFGSSSLIAKLTTKVSSMRLKYSGEAIPGEVVNTYPNPSFETALANVGTNGTSNSLSTVWAGAGSSSLRVIASTPTASDIYSTITKIPGAVPGKKFSIMVAVYSPIAIASFRPPTLMETVGGWRTLISGGSQIPLAAGVTVFSLIGTMPADLDVNNVTLIIRCAGLPNNWDATNPIYYDKLMSAPRDTAFVAADYADGSMAAYEWTGTPHVSSTRKKRPVSQLLVKTKAILSSYTSTIINKTERKI